MTLSVQFKDGSSRLITGVRMATTYLHAEGAAPAEIVIHFTEIGKQIEWLPIEKVQFVIIHHA